ncbi:MAG: LptA/OstA family protein, partial [Candidatus Eremiobacteraeota bacterium]|nr:LptA/OstA family protein [Candidatus Eremiobacteraeota bacterium]
MRPFAALLIVLVFLTPGVHAAPAPPAVVITAQRIVLYSNRGMLIADGGVSARSTNVQIEGTRALYDLNANTLTVSGDVSVTQNGTVSSGSGYVYEYKTLQGHFVPDVTIPQLSQSEATAVAQQVELHPAASITFTNAQVSSGGVLTATASYTYGIPPPNAKDFGYSPVPSAAIEWSRLLTSGRDAYSFARFRYNRYTGGPGAGLEEHYARTGRGYLAFGQTLDVYGGRFDLVAFQRMNATLTQTVTGSTLLGSK